MDSRQGSDTRAANSVIDGFFTGAPAWAVVGLSVVFVIAVGLLDDATGPGATLAPFYLMPVLLVTWNVGRVWGLAVAGLATVATQVAGVSVGAGEVLVPSWNAVLWFSVLVFVVWLLSVVKAAAMQQGRQLVAQAQTSDGLRAQNDLKDTLLHAVSHDLKGPLAGVLGGIQTLRRAEVLGLSADEKAELLDVVEQSGAKASRLVDDILDLDRLRRGQLQPEREPTDVIDLARRAATDVPALVGHPVRVDGDPVLVEVDAAKVERIVENLLGNAGRHTPAGTPVHVGVRREGNGVLVTVEDEGPGVPEDIKEAIFEPFRQGEHSRGGVGIGLSLVRRFAELHGGTARVEDRPGGGARFVVVLPGRITTAAVLRAV